MTKTKVFVYGTLKKGGYFFDSYNLGDLAYSIKEAYLDGYALYQGVYPYVLPSNPDKVLGEVHEYNEHLLDLFDIIEGHPYLYRRKEKLINYPDGTKEKVWVYVPIDMDAIDYDGSGKKIERGEYLV